MSLADLQNDHDAERSYRKFRLIAEDVQGRNVLTNFHGMDLTTDKLRCFIIVPYLLNFAISTSELISFNNIISISYRGSAYMILICLVSDVDHVISLSI